jgi:hypothetical protein
MCRSRPGRVANQVGKSILNAAWSATLVRGSSMTASRHEHRRILESIDSLKRTYPDLFSGN